MIKLDNLSRQFRTDSVLTTALNGINLTVNQGEFVAIMGPSGCGKSTLLNVLGMLDSPTSGAYWFAQKDIANDSEKALAKLRKQNLGFVFQSFNLIDELTVYQNVELPLLYQNVPGRERKQRVEAILAQMQIAHRRDHLPQQLSGGQQQRVAVARALIIQPALILADEPTGNLDSQNSEAVMNLLCELNRAGTTIIMVTHSDEDASYASRTVRMRDGQIVADTPAEVKQYA
ncbi:ABC transporter ATP-binding protein [Ferrimonas pelagia]|uniref:ABC transporter ATP-binding protein n=1 Tax=Ferrimonas pelagia TaxID=1177826 RepID=A0ABP9FBN3_9GAMM